MFLEAPVNHLNESADNSEITVCLNRNAYDCNYLLDTGGSAGDIKMPFKGRVEFINPISTVNTGNIKKPNPDIYLIDIDGDESSIRDVNISLSISKGGKIIKMISADSDLFRNHHKTRVVAGQNSDSVLEWDFTAPDGSDWIYFGNKTFSSSEVVNLFVEITVPVRSTSMLPMSATAFIIPENYYNDTPYTYNECSPVKMPKLRFIR